MPDLHITHHALQRLHERAPGVCDDVLSSRAVQTAADFGAPFVKLGTGQRIVVRDGAVVTVLPNTCSVRSLDRRTRP